MVRADRLSGRARRKAAFRGGIRVTGFLPVSDPSLLDRLPKAAHGKVFSAELKPLGLKSIKPLKLGGYDLGHEHFVTHPTEELFFNGRAMTLARWPNRGHVKIDDVAAESQKDRFIYNGDRLLSWCKAEDAWLHGYWSRNWSESYERIVSINPSTREVTVAPPYPRKGFAKGQPFCVVNVLSEIDMPGEWYLDRKKMVVYCWPPSDPTHAVVELSLNEFPFVTMRDVEYVTFEGLTWELGGGDGIIIEDGYRCLFAGCTIRCCGGNGVEIAGGTGHGLLSCDIHTLGRGGTLIDGGDRKTLSSGQHFVENCRIYDLSRIDRTYTPAVLMNGVGNRIAHNLLHDIPSSAIRLNGNDHTVEYNDVHSVVLESDDQGGLDMCGDPTYRGNVIRYNFWHHIGHWRLAAEGTDCGQGGVRLDDMICGVLIYGNIFYHASSGRLGFGGVQIHGGKDNIIDNNIFVKCEAAVSLTTWREQRWRSLISGTLKSPQINAALYLTKYPQLARLTENQNYNIVSRNLIVQCRDMFRRNSSFLDAFDNMMTDADPGFKNAAQGDFQLEESAPAALQLGFRPIPVDEIGLYVDKFRVKLPPREMPE